MTRPPKHVTIARICAYLISKTKSVTVDIVWQPKAFVSSSEQKTMLKAQCEMRAQRLACKLAMCDKTLENWFMLSVRISSYGCTREVWRAQEKRVARGVA